MTRRVPRSMTLALMLCITGCATFQPVYLTWEGDPATTMTVTTQTPPRVKSVQIHYDTQSHGGTPSAYENEADCATWRIRGLEQDRRIHSAALSGLTPGARYYFVLSDGTAALTEEESFQTIPSDTEHLRFICGGDMSGLPRARRLLKQAAKCEPMFGIIGGDIAYANGNPRKVGRWDAWFRNWCDTMVTSEGCLVPIVAAVGNHEVNGDVGSEQDRAPFYYGFLPQGGRSYFTRHFGANTAIHILDSDHLVPHDGAQAVWLERSLNESQGRKNRLAVYHVPLYPSHREYEYAKSRAGRTHWMPLFDAFHLDIAFEHHDHTLKRTKPLRAGAVDPEGTVYLGDGSFGVPPRRVTGSPRWYLEHAGRTPHFWSVTIDGDRIDCAAIGIDGRTMDRYSRP